jgi:hypothetical protein
MHALYINFIRIFICSAIFLIGYIKTASAQTNELSGWAAWFHTQRFSKHWGASFDGQFRSAHHAEYLKNVLLRPNLNYYFGGNKSATLGYAYVSTNGRTATGAKTFVKRTGYLSSLYYSKGRCKYGYQSSLSFRATLFGSTPTQQEVFSQRVRYFIRGLIPFNNEPTFTNGTFLALQNEVFANVQNKAKVNNHFFDQNRAYVAFGYRINKKIDIEAGYLNQYIQQTQAHTINHIAQIALYTRFGQ